MSRWPRLRVAWIYTKQYSPAVMAAALISGGIGQILTVLKYPLANGIVKVINAIITRGFRDRVLLTEYWGFPWPLIAKIVAEGAMVAVLGIFFGLWANARSQRAP